MNIELLLTGFFGVGKSSLYNRFIYDEFESKYFGTLGVRVNEKEIIVNDTAVNFKIWDVAGEVKQNKVPKPYFVSPQVIIYVMDLTRMLSFKQIPADIAYLNEIAKDKLVKVIGNKIDLLSEHDLEVFKERYPEIRLDLVTSAKTGKNVNELFQLISNEMLNKNKSA